MGKHRAEDSQPAACRSSFLSTNVRCSVSVSHSSSGNRFGCEIPVSTDTALIPRSKFLIRGLFSPQTIAGRALRHEPLPSNDSQKEHKFAQSKKQSTPLWRSHLFLSGGSVQMQWPQDSGTPNRRDGLVWPKEFGKNTNT